MPEISAAVSEAELGDNPQQAAVLYSPANLYLVLGMLTEMSDGQTRKQIRDAIGGISVNGDFPSDMSKEEVDAALRKQEQVVIQKAAQVLYASVSSKKCRLADSVWLSDRYDFLDSGFKGTGEELPGIM